MRFNALGLAFVAASIATPTDAQQVSDSVRWVGADRLEINSTVLAPNGCYSAGSATAGHPAGSMAVRNAVLLTYSLKHTEGMCTQALTPVMFSITTEAAKDDQAIVVYTIDPRTKSTTVRAVYLPAR